MRWNFWREQQSVVAASEAPKKERAIKFSLAALARLGKKTASPKPFAIDVRDIYKPPPGVLPSGAATMAMDSGISESLKWASNLGYDSDGLRFMGYAYLAELTQRAEYRRISEVIAKEMTRKWIKLQAVGDEDKADKIKVLTAAIKKFKVQDAFRHVAELDGFFGRAHIYLDTGKTEDLDELKTQLIIDPAKIGKGSLKRLQVVEPLWTYPGLYTSNNPLKEDFYNPQSWWVNGIEIHASRFLTFVSRKMPDLLKPAYLFGGLSMSQMAKPYVDFWIRDRTSVSNLVHKFSVFGLKTNLSALLSEPGDGGPANRIEAFNKMRDNDGVLMLDMTSEDFFNISVPLSTLDKLQAQAQEHMASVSGIPLVILLGITPSGLNASSDGEIRSFYAWIKALQESFFADNLSIVLKVIQLSEFGEIDDSITAEFVDLWELDAAGKAAVQKTIADTAAVYIQEGVVSPEEDRKRVATEADSMYHGLDLSGPAPTPPDDGTGPNLDDPETNRVDEGGESGSNSGV